jgi:hypothetical protein
VQGSWTIVDDSAISYVAGFNGGASIQFEGTYGGISVAISELEWKPSGGPVGKVRSFAVKGVHDASLIFNLCSDAEQ